MCCSCAGVARENWVEVHKTVSAFFFEADPEVEDLGSSMRFDIDLLMGETSPSFGEAASSVFISTSPSVVFAPGLSSYFQTCCKTWIKACFR